jgi:hypothetical protein
MFHFAFSTGGEHASAAFHSIARAQSRGFEPRWPSIDGEVEPSPGIEHILRRHRLAGPRPPPDTKTLSARLVQTPRVGR